MKKHDDPIKLSFRKTYMLVTFFILCLACLLSLALVLFFLNTFYSGPITQIVVIITGILICGLAIMIGGFILWKSSSWISKPIVELDKAVNKVATGDFEVEIKPQNPMLTHHEIHTEITTLVSNFNIMTKELKGMDYMSKDFMSNVSHEIKTPLSTITGITEMLLDEDFKSNENNEYLRIVNESSERISDLCNSMLKLSKLDSRQILDKKDIVRLDEQIRKAAIMTLESYGESDRILDFDLSEVLYKCDSDLMMQVWVNLIENAIKYSADKSKISIRMKKVELADKSQYFEIQVHNEGEAIPEEKVRRMFDRFYQCDLSHKDQGNGLGLSIVARIIKLHEGRIYCNSSHDKGITMTVELY